MKKNLFILFLLTVFLTGCNLFRSNMKVDQLVQKKQAIDATHNPARKMQIIDQLKRKKLLIINNLLVKDVILSTNIDYDFCVIADLVAGDKKVECFIYSKNLKDIAKLVKGKSRINVKGHFNRFFSVLDDYYTKIDIVKAKISRVKTAEAAETTKEEKK